MAGHSVAGGYSLLSDTQLGQFHRRIQDILRQVHVGSLDFGWVMEEIQNITDGKVRSPDEGLKIWKTISSRLNSSQDTSKNGAKLHFLHILSQIHHENARFTKDLLSEKVSFQMFARLSPQVSFVKVRPMDVGTGVEKTVSLSWFYTRVFSTGLKLSSPEMIVLLTFQTDKDRPEGAELFIGMNPVGKNEVIFTIKKTTQGKEILSSVDTTYFEMHGLPRDSEWIFVKR